MLALNIKKEDIILIPFFFHFLFFTVIFFLVNGLRIPVLANRELIDKIYYTEYFFILVLVSIISLSQILKVRKIHLSHIHERILFCFVPLTLLAAIIGLLNQNSIRYIINDSISLLYLPLLYFLLNSYYYHGIAKEFMRKLYYMFLFLALLDFCMQLFFFVNGRVVITNSIFYLFPLLYLLFLEKRSLREYLIMSLLFISAILTFKRTLWVVLIFILFCYFIYSFFYKKKKIQLVTVFILPLILSVFVFFIFPNQVKYAVVRITQTTNSFSNIYTLENSIARRMIENYALINIAKSSDLGTILFGRGLGSELNLADSYLPSRYYMAAGDSKFLIHSIHGTPQTFFFRTGILGLFLFLMFSFFLFKMLWRLAFKFKYLKKYSIALFFFFLIHISFSVTAYIFWFDIWFLIFFLATGWLLRDYDYQLKNNETL